RSQSRARGVPLCPGEERSSSPGSSLDGSELDDLYPGGEASGLSRVEASRAELDNRRGRAADRRPQRVSDRAAVEALGQVAAQEDVPGADRCDRLDARDRRAEALHPPLLAHEREARGLLGDEDVARAEVGDRVERHRELLLVVELLADEALRLLLVRRDEIRLGLDAHAQRLSLAVEHAFDAAPGQVVNRVGVPVVLDVAWQRAAEDDVARDA